MVLVLNNSQIDEQQAKERERLTAIQGVGADNPMVTSLAGHIRTCWDQAQRAKIEIETQMLANLRQREGIYDTKKLTAIRALKSSEVYMMIAGTKCRDAKNWVDDILFQPGTVPWDIEPTPKPQLPPAVEQQVRSTVTMRMLDIAMQAGMGMTIQELVAQTEAMMPDIREQVRKGIKDQAKKLAGEMREEIDDQLTEGGFYRALATCLPDLILHTGFVKGPIYRKLKALRIDGDYLSDRAQVSVEDQVIPQYERVSMWDMFPAPNSTGIDDGYLIERLNFSGIDLHGMIGLPGFDEAAIRGALAAYGQGGLREWTALDSERAQIEQKNSSAIWDSDKIQSLLFWGHVQGRMLNEWAQRQMVNDLERFYPVSAYLIGRFVIKASLNPRPLGKKPYSKASWEEIEGAFWGKGLPQVIKDVCDVCNATARALVNNVGMASGPQVEVDMERVPGDKTLIPWKVWGSSPDMLKTGNPAMRFYQPPMVADKLMVIYQQFSKIADEHSGVPAYAHGSEDVGGAGDTASGLSMLMTAAARGIKGIVKMIDRNIIEPCVERQYYENISRREFSAFIADLKIVAKGSSSLIAKEQQSIRRNEFLKTTQNPLDAMIMGEGRRFLLQETAKSLELDVEKTVPDQPLLPPNGMMPGGPPAPAPNPGMPRALNPAGEPVAGQDFDVSKEK